MEITIRVYRNNCIAKNYCLTSGCVNTVTALYLFDEEWEGLQRLAVFETIAGTVHVPLDDNNRCYLPPVVLEQSGTIRVGAMGVRGEQTFTTTTVPLVVVKGVDKEGTSAPGYSPTVLEHLLQLAEETKGIAQGVREDADAGKFDGYTPRRGVDYWTPSDKNNILATTCAQSAVSAEEELYRYSRRINLFQNGGCSASFDAAGRRGGSTLQSWYFTDYSNSTVYGDFTAMFGFFNTCMGNANLICGTRNDVTGRALIVGGENNLIANSAESGLFFGRFGYVNNASIICAIGNGASNSNRYNLLEIHKNGKIAVKNSYSTTAAEFSFTQLRNLSTINVSALATKTDMASAMEKIPAAIREKGLFRKEIFLTRSGDVYELDGTNSNAENNLVKLSSINDVLPIGADTTIFSKYKFIFADNSFLHTVELNAEYRNDRFLFYGIEPSKESMTEGCTYYIGEVTYDYDVASWNPIVWTISTKGGV